MKNQISEQACEADEWKVKMTMPFGLETRTLKRTQLETPEGPQVASQPIR